jgi:hypothetical protein
LLPAATIATDRDTRHEPVSVRRVPRAVRDLDELLFSPDGWFAIDARNGQVPGVVVPTLEAGLDLVGRGDVATIVGRLRPEVAVVDVDVDGPPGWAVAESVTAWAGSEGLWSLVRPSGGADGRCHVFLVPGARYDGLRGLIDQLRASFRVSAKRIDLRRAVRPLSAPHRRGGRTPLPHGSLAGALEALQGQPWAGRSARPFPTAPPPRGTGSTLRSAAASLRRRGCEMPREWADFLATGTRPRIGGSDHSRTTYEAIATLHLVRGGHTAESAWQQILAAHPEAMVRARSSCTRWVRWVWNPAVEDDRAHIASAPVPPEVAAAVSAGRDALERLQWQFSVRRRPAFLLVGHLILDRMLRTGSLRVPVPERDLYLDTGIDRKTVREVLRALDGRLGDLDRDAWDPGNRDGSSFEFILHPAEREEVRQTSPPSPHTPLPSGVWASLPRTCHALWRTLTRVDEALTTPVLCRRAGMTAGWEDEPGLSTVRTARAALSALARAGLVVCTESGLWVARAAVSTEYADLVRRQRAEREESVAAERAAFRAATHSAWAASRGVALRRNHERERAWWGSLDPAERVERCRVWASRFQALSVVEQEALKGRLARRRIDAGVDEPRRHDGWVDALSMDAYLRRSIQRQVWFTRLPSPQRQAYAIAWRRHRERFGISQGTTLASQRRELADALPAGREARDAAYLQADQLLLPLAVGDLSTAV